MEPVALGWHQRRGGVGWGATSAAKLGSLGLGACEGPGKENTPLPPSNSQVQPVQPGRPPVWVSDR